jgi:hypothetical protein
LFAVEVVAEQPDDCLVDGVPCFRADEVVVFVEGLPLAAATAGLGLACDFADVAVVVVAYNGLDGLPRVVPIGIFWTGEEIVMSTAATAPKVEALSARPEVALTIDAGDTPGSAKNLSVRGIVHLTMVDGVVPEYLAAARKNFDPEFAVEFERSCRAMYDRMARIALELQWARYYDFGIGRMPQFLAELAAKAR